MPPEDELDWERWLEFAEGDWARVQRFLPQDDPEVTAFFLQQAVEKFLKTYLLRHGHELRRIHDLVGLLNEAIAHDESLKT